MTALLEFDTSTLNEREKYRALWLAQTRYAPLILDPSDPDGLQPICRPRPNQVTPSPHALCPLGEACGFGPSHVPWFTWFVKAGRGFGKTKTAAEDMADFALSYDGVSCGLVAATYSEGRDVMVEGRSGLLSCLPPSELRGGRADRAWNRSLGELVLANGSHFKLTSSEKPDSPRGKNWHRCWMDEPASFGDAAKGDVAETTYNNAVLAVRESLPGNAGRAVPGQTVITGTPKNLKLIKDVLALPNLVLTQGSTYENLHNLDPAFRERIIRYEGTHAGRQELHGEVLDEVEGALWTMAWFEAGRVPRDIFDARFRQRMRRIAVGVDPAGSTAESADDTGIIVAGKSGPRCPVCNNTDRRSHFFVWRDETCHLSPAGWAARVVECFEEEAADKVIAEKNYGGEMVEHTLHSVNDALPIEMVTAHVGKRPRAQPVAALYEPKVARVHHVGDLGPLEAECCGWDPEDEKAPSPNRMDALVWVLWWLSQGHRLAPGRGMGSQIAEHRL